MTRRGYFHAQRQVFIGDGALWIWNLASMTAPNAIQIVDLYHAKEPARNGSRDYTATRTVTVNGSTSSSPPSSNEGYPAAPAIAARLLKEAGVKPKHAGGNYISDVARLMTKSAVFMGVEKTHSTYESKVRWYLRSVNALP